MILDNPYHRRKVKLMLREIAEQKEIINSLRTVLSELKKDNTALKRKLTLARKEAPNAD
jgi:methionine salvage enolase-phosphatase E1